jgi:hypothetical protein
MHGLDFNDLDIFGSSRAHHDNFSLFGRMHGISKQEMTGLKWKPF